MQQKLVFPNGILIIFVVLLCDMCLFVHGGIGVRGRRPRAHSPTPTMPPPTNEVDEGCCPHIATKKGLVKVGDKNAFSSFSYCAWSVMHGPHKQL